MEEDYNNMLNPLRYTTILRMILYEDFCANISTKLLILQTESSKIGEHGEKWKMLALSSIDALLKYPIDDCWWANGSSVFRMWEKTHAESVGEDEYCRCDWCACSDIAVNSVKYQDGWLESCQCRQQDLNDCELAISIALGSFRNRRVYFLGANFETLSETLCEEEVDETVESVAATRKVRMTAMRSRKEG